MAKGGRTEQKQTLPAWAEAALQKGITMGENVAATGYVPYYGPDVAAFSPMQNAAFQGTDVMAGAFGMPTTGGQSYMPQPTQFEGGVMGYSSAPLYEASMDQLQANRPAQYDYINSFSIDPVTGVMGSRTPQKTPVKLEMQGGRRRGK
jgi:hypothetical protein